MGQANDCRRGQSSYWALTTVTAAVSVFDETRMVDRDFDSTLR